MGDEPHGTPQEEEGAPQASQAEDAQEASPEGILWQPTPTPEAEQKDRAIRTAKIELHIFRLLGAAALCIGLAFASAWLLWLYIAWLGGLS